jgi:hypothetical protein
VDTVKLRELCERATPGPWRKGSPTIKCILPHFPHGQGQCEYGHHGWDDYREVHQDRPYTGQDDAEAGLIAGQWDYEEGGIRKDEDAAFIAAARTALPECLDLIEYLRAVESAARYLMSLGDEQDIVWFTAYEALRAALRGEPKEGM